METFGLGVQSEGKGKKQSGNFRFNDTPPVHRDPRFSQDRADIHDRFE